MRDRNTLNAVAIAAEFGFGIALSFVICGGGGWYLDGQLGTTPWLVMTGLFMGLLGVVASFYRLATAFDNSRKPAKERAPLPLKPEEDDDFVEGPPGRDMND
jgi:F0F1-type ATP synthase assembly protein I